MALVAYNLFSALKTILGRVHDTEVAGKLSDYYLADELEGTYRGMMIALPPSEWLDFGQMSLLQLSSLLQDWATKVNISAFTSAPRKPKKPKPKPIYDPAHPHVSTARLLAEKTSFNRNGRKGLINAVKVVISTPRSSIAKIKTSSKVVTYKTFR